MGVHNDDLAPPITAPLSDLVLRGSLAVGNHGPLWTKPQPPTQEYIAILRCGRLQTFLLPPTTGDLLWCVRCDEWETCRVIGGSCVACDDCDLYQEYGHDRHRALRHRRDHAVGRDGHRTVTHRASVGTHTRTGVVFEYHNDHGGDRNGSPD